MKLEKAQRLVIIAVIALFVIIVGAVVGLPLIRGAGDPQPAADTTASNRSEPQPVVDTQPVKIGDGGKAAQVFVDFHCPHCADFEEQFGGQLLAAAEAGEVQLQIFPMSFIDAGSTRAANAFACAAEAGFAAPYYRTLFANAELRWSDDQLIAAAYQPAGVQPAGSQPAFEDCVRTNAKAGWVASINTSADKAKINQTPTLIVGNKTADITTLTPESLRALLAG